MRLRRPSLSATGTGIGAGAALLAVMCADAASSGESAFTPFSLSASVVLGEAVSHSDASFTLLVGILFGTAASVAFGFCFSQLQRVLPEQRSDSWGRPVLIGVAFGAAVYLVAFQVVARLAFPWLLHTEQPAWFVAHAFVYGPLLSVMHEVGVRRERERLAFFSSYG